MRTFFIILLMATSASTALAGEDCGMMGGRCRDACLPGEEAAQGSFLDCTDKQECCVPGSEPRERTAVIGLMPEERCITFLTDIGS